MKNNLSIIPLFLLLFLLSGCSFEKAVAVTTAVVDQVSTPTYRKLAPTWTLTPTLAPPSATPSPTATKTTTPTITFTPLPTLPVAEANFVAMKMLSENKDCKLPCWWGIHPGKTTLGEAENMIRRITQNIEISDEYSDQDYYVGISVKYKISASSDVFNFDLNAKNGLVDNMFLPKKTNRNFYIQNLLNLHGLPKEILINTFPASPSYTEIPFSLLIIYDEGIFAFYYTGAASKPGNDHALYCPGGTNPEMLYLFNTNSDQDYQEHEKSFLKLLEYWTSDAGMKPINEVSALDIKSFYNLAVQDESACIKTPLEKWISSTPRP